VIHPTAIIHPKARLDSTVEVGPYAIINENVQIGPNCIIGPHVVIDGVTTIGARNRFHAGCVIGDAPQDLKYRNEPTRLRIGDENVFREHVTAHRSTKPDEETVIGSNNFLMANAHVGHNCVVGNHVIFANGVLLGGHVTVQDRAFLSGNCMVHQFARVGMLVMMQGGAAVSQDVPPFTIASGINGICGLNIVGLRRAGFTSEERLELKRLYHVLFRSGKNFREAVNEAMNVFSSRPSKIVLEFVSSAKRGVCPDVGARAGRSTEDAKEDSD
jgi:acyl-[acyl-carrier-protein]--UDP-N-acetylglucosamine O-acyltransferase